MEERGWDNNGKTAAQDALLECIKIYDMAQVTGGKNAIQGIAGHHKLLDLEANSIGNLHHKVQFVLFWRE